MTGLRGVMQTFGVSEEVATLGLSLFVLGFALGPLLWSVPILVICVGSRS